MPGATGLLSAQVLWRKFTEAPENAVLYPRYWKAAKEPRTFIEAIGEDLGSSDEARRSIAFEAFARTLIEIANILNEQESHRPGWRGGAGKDQDLINYGMENLAHLYQKFVKEHHFKTDQGKGRDPLPYIRAMIMNKVRDELRSTNRHSSLNEILGQQHGEARLKALIQDSNTSVEDKVVNNISREEFRHELITRKFLKETELDLFDLVYRDRLTLQEVAAQLDISYDNTRQKFSRARRKYISIRDSIFIIVLIDGILEEPRFANKEYAIWYEWARESIRPWNFGDMAGEGMLFQLFKVPLTSALDDKPGDIHLCAIPQKQYDVLGNAMIKIDEELIFRDCALTIDMGTNRLDFNMPHLEIINDIADIWHLKIVNTNRDPHIHRWITKTLEKADYGKY